MQKKAILYGTLLILAILFSNRVHSEDIEIFNNSEAPPESNILFLLDQSGSMHNTPLGSGTRATALQASFNSILSDPELTGINVGLMEFSNGSSDPYAHGVSFPVSPIDTEVTPILLSNLLPQALNDGINLGYFSLEDDTLPDPFSGETVRQYLPRVLNSWVGTGPTPIVDAFYEAALYFRGATPEWGATSSDQNEAAHPSTYEGTIPSVISSQPTGGSVLCDEPDCGVDCSPYTSRFFCAEGETSCYSGTNCEYGESTTNYICRLGSEAECLVSNAAYESCSPYPYKSCSMSCNGTTDPSSGQCLGEEVEVCTLTDAFICSLTTAGTKCDYSRYICKTLEDTVVPTVDARYRSPITDQCQNNSIILLSDGQPNVMGGYSTANSQERVKSLLGSAVDCRPVSGQADPKTTFNTLIDGRCGSELAEFLATEDQSSTVEGDNTVKTYTVGFGIANDPGAEGYLKSIAASGGGEYYSASDTETLINSFKSIITNEGRVARNFSAPVYTVDPHSLLANSQNIYLPLFENSHLPAWAGNIKKFKLDAEGKIIDREGRVAIDAQGALKPSAIDFWSDASHATTSDSNPVITGGAASQLDPSNRTLYTNSGNHLVSLNSNNVSKDLLGNADMSDAYKDQLIKFIRGFEEDGVTARKQMGDILHSKPTVISYGDRQVLFFGTNEGYLHAIDASDSSDQGTGGKELFAFMPDSLLKNIDGLWQNKELTGPLKRIYGIDGAITAWVKDINKNGQLDTDKGEFAYLFFGLRRGGGEYYALDVSNPDNPRLLWMIKDRGAFSQLGETWSKPTLAKMRYLKSGVEVFDDVLVFGGGYDNRLDEENPSARTPLSDSQGNAIYIVNAKTGDLIWSYSSGELQHSVPGNIRVLDLDRDGSIDRLYFGDTGGNIWRADLNVDNHDDDPSMHDVITDARGYKFAALSGEAADNRKFFYEPDVSFFKYKGRHVLMILIGSGYRSHPLNTQISDRFYVLSDENVLNIPESTPSPLKDSNLISSSALAGDVFFPTYKGWYKDLMKGKSEKVLAPAVTFMNKVMFTTFAVTDPITSTVTSVEGCASPSAKQQTSAYILDLMTASATVDLDGDGRVSSVDESETIVNGDILDSPQLVFNKPSNCTKEGCNQFVDIRIGKQLYPLVDQSTVGANVDLGSFLPKIFWLKVSPNL